MGKMKELDDLIGSEWHRYEYEHWIAQEQEKEVTTTYQLTEIERKALNEYMEGSHAFYSINGSIHNSSNVLELYGRKKRRNEVLKTMQNNKKD